MSASKLTARAIPAQCAVFITEPYSEIFDNQFDLQVQAYCYRVAEFDTRAVGREADSPGVELGDIRAGSTHMTTMAPVWLLTIFAHRFLNLGCA